MRASATSACALALAFMAGCGGSGGGDQSGGHTKADAQKVITEFAAAVNARDGAKLCETLFTTAYVERTTGARGAAAITQCKAQIASLQAAGSYRVTRFVSTTVDGDKATVVADLDTAGEKRRTTMRLVDQGGDFRLSSGTGR